MKTIAIFPLLALVLTACGPLPSSDFGTQSIGSPASHPIVGGVADTNDVALFLAGRPVRHGAKLSQIQQTEEYQRHQQEMNRIVRAKVMPRVNVTRSWADTEVTPTPGSGGTVYYPFGGPDLLYVKTMFPRAGSYALMGLEPVGAVPALETMPQGEVLKALAAFRESTKTQLLIGYFITKDMRSDLEHSALRGVTPILLSTVAMTGGTVESVSAISAGGNPGVELRFSDAGGAHHTAYYVAGDLSNSGFKGGYHQWVAGLGGKATYFKAASYLMHDDHFSQARDFFLSQSNLVLQDDSGIPYRFFKPEQWTFRFYGNYEKPIELFANRRQEDLKQAYATNPRLPVGFGSGYRTNYYDANLMIAVRR
jgi:hypothetical protein